MTDYGQAVDGVFVQAGKVRYLEDTDQDGQYDRATIFVDGLRFPTDVKVWREGVLICDAPDILYCEDTDADGHADVRDVLFSGFATHNGQARVNSLRWGMDGWVYGSCGLFGGEIVNSRGETLNLGGRDFRMRPETGEIEPVTGTTQQGRACNELGEWFGCDNGTLLRHYPTSDHYLRRNPFLSPPPSAVFVPGGTDPNRLFPRGELVQFKLSGPAGRPTSACGLGFYRDDALGAEYEGNAFVCEPVNQLVHRERIARHGVTFVGETRTGRAIERVPQFNRPVVSSRSDPHRSGRRPVDRGHVSLRHRTPDLDPGGNQASAQRLRRPRHGAHLSRCHPGVARPRLLTWQNTAAVGKAARKSQRRATRFAQQAIQTRPDGVPLDEIRLLARHAASPAVQVQAIYTLNGLHQLDPELCLQLLEQAHPEVRRHVIRLVEQFARDDPRIEAAIVDATTAPQPFVRQQAAYSLGEIVTQTPATSQALLRLLRESDEYLCAAALSSVNRENIVWLAEQVYRQAAAESAGDPAIVAPQLAKMLVQLAPAEAVRQQIDWLAQHVDMACCSQRQFDLFFELLLAMQEHGKPLSEIRAQRSAVVDQRLTQARQMACDAGIADTHACLAIRPAGL